MTKQSYAVGRKPDFLVKAMNKATSEKRKIGAAWRNKDGSISIDIDAFTVLTSSPDLVVTLFPIDRSPINAEAEE